MKRISCLALLVAVTLSPTGRAADPAALAAIKQIGGTVRPMAQDRSDWDVAFNLSGRELTDEGLVHVAQLDNVASLNLKGTRITGAGLVHLRQMKSLQMLHLEQTAIDDQGIKHLADLQNLRYLNLYGTKITDKSLDQLAGLKNLQRIYVWQTAVTDDGVARLAQALPNLKIVRGVDLSMLPATVVAPPPPPAKPIQWIATSNAADAPKSQNGDNIEVVFENKSKRKVKIVWVGYGGELKLYGELEPGKTHDQNTYANNTWLITDTDDKPLGYFICGPERCLAVIPEK